MNKSFLIIITLCLACCVDESVKLRPGQTENGGKYSWTKVLDTAPWSKSYNFRMYTLRDTMWTFHPDGVWSSTDGINWAKSSLSNAVNNLGFLDYTYFDGAMYGLGHFEGNIERFSFQPIIYRSTDLRQWNVLSKSSNLPARFFYHPFVFKNKIWIIGGEDRNGKYADVWSSSDGTNWVMQRDNLPFGGRSGSQFVQFKNKLFMLGNDVWSSVDGLNWKKETDEIVNGVTIFGYCVVVFDNKIWLIGCNRNEQFSSQVLTSENGVDWKSEEAPWSPRGGVAATVFHNNIYITGGKYGGTPNHPDFRYSNDIWKLTRD